MQKSLSPGYKFWNNVMKATSVMIFRFMVLMEYMLQLPRIDSLLPELLSQLRFKVHHKMIGLKVVNGNFQSPLMIKSEVVSLEWKVRLVKYLIWQKNTFEVGTEICFDFSWKFVTFSLLGLFNVFFSIWSNFLRLFPFPLPPLESFHRKVDNVFVGSFSPSIRYVLSRRL